MARIYAILLPVILLSVAVCSQEDWANCTPCRCAWVNGRKNADCRKNDSVVLTSIPTNLSSEIRSIDFTEQTLYTLRRYVFQQAKLGDLQKIKLVSCELHEIDVNAFRNMSLLIELDLSKNKIQNLHQDTFRSNQRLRILNLNENRLEELKDGLFANLTYLQRVDLERNKIHTIGIDAFFRNDKLQHVLLDSNRLVNLSGAFRDRIAKISYLSLQDNPWRCDCHLKEFRDFAINRLLLTHASLTSCAEPDRLRGRRWTDLESSDFACRPRIVYPPNSQLEIEATEENVTMCCKVSGDPTPDVNWVFRHAIIDVTPGRPNARRYRLVHSNATETSTYWLNLTVFNINYQDAGVYKCVAKNPGGIQERNITLHVRGSSIGGAVLGTTQEVWLLALAIILLLVTIALLAAIIAWCCIRRRRRQRDLRLMRKPLEGNGQLPVVPDHQPSTPDMEKSLITAVNPVVKPPRHYSVPPSVASGVTELSELNRTLLDNDSTYACGDEDSRSLDWSERGGQRNPNQTQYSDFTWTTRPYPPDLLSFPARGGVPSPSPHSPPPTDQYRTLPYSRSHSPFTPPPRAGYVTIPRRPRVPSWTGAPNTPLLPEPVYDNLGLRTTAEGSSVLSLNKLLTENNTLKNNDTPKHNPENTEIQLGSPLRAQPDGALDSRRLSASSLASVPEGKKVPPRPPPKPRKNVSGATPLFEDEGEDGTEV